MPRQGLPSPDHYDTHYRPPIGVGVLGELQLLGGRLGPPVPAGALRLLVPKLPLVDGEYGCTLGELAGVTLLLDPEIGALKPLGLLKPLAGVAELKLLGLLKPGLDVELLPNEPGPVDMPGWLNRDGLLVLPYGAIELLPVELEPMPGGNDGGGGLRCVLLHPHSSIPPTSKAPILSQGLDPIRYLLTP